MSANTTCAPQTATPTFPVAIKVCVEVRASTKHHVMADMVAKR